MLGIIRTIVLILMASILTAFFMQNFTTTEVAFLTWSIAAPRAVVFLIVFGCGLAAGYLACTFAPRRRVALPKSEPDVVRRGPAPPADGGTAV